MPLVPLETLENKHVETKPTSHDDSIKIGPQPGEDGLTTLHTASTCKSVCSWSSMMPWLAGSMLLDFQVHCLMQFLTPALGL